MRPAGEFHLDVLPAREDAMRGDSCIEVPDRKLGCWKPSNPEGYRRWFDHQCLVALQKSAAAAAEPIPENLTAEQKAVLQKTVQLMKRHRDCVFSADDDAPRSVVLTTLAAMHYDGSANVAEALQAILAGIGAQAVAAAPGRIVVLNPTNPDEEFSEAWTAATYVEFVSFVRSFHGKLIAASNAQGLDSVATALAEMFGETLVTRVIKAHMHELSAARTSNDLRVINGGLAIAPLGGGVVVPRNIFYGD